MANRIAPVSRRSEHDLPAGRWPRPMRNVLGRVLMLTAVVSLMLTGLAAAQAGERPRHRLRERLRAGSPYPASPYYNPYVDVHYWYPKYYGGFHYRTLYRAGYSSPNYPYRGLPW